MQIQEQTTEAIERAPNFPALRVSTKINFAIPNAEKLDVAPKTNSNAPAPPLFEHLAHTTLAERFPRLTCFAVSLGLLACALITEIEFLKGSGYFWR